jgi:DNA-binding MarR family transcriptional regulator
VETDVDQRLGMALKRAEQSLVRAKSAAIKPSGVTLAQYVALGALDDEPGVTSAALARKCLVTPQAMMVVLKSMEEQGLVERTPHPRHPNVLEVHLTDVGREALETARNLADPVELRVSDEFSAREMETLRRLLTRLNEALDQG